MSAEAEMNAELGITELAHWTMMWPMMSHKPTPFYPNPKSGHFVPVGIPLVSIKKLDSNSTVKLKTINEFWNCIGGFDPVGGF